jgi:hypothetical protein
MGYASRSGRARTSSSNPQAHAICDRCGFRYNNTDLKFQFDWRGTSLQNLRILVCSTCYDTPQQQLRALTLPADPVPIMNARVQDFVAASTDYRATSGQNTVDPVTGLTIPGTTARITQDNANRVAQETGEPPYGTNQQPGTDPTVPNAAGGNNPGLPYGFVAVPKTGPL